MFGEPRSIRWSNVSANPLGVGIGIGIEGKCMGFGHERLEVYRAAVDYVGRAYPGTIPMPIATPTEAKRALTSGTKPHSE